MTAPPRGEYSVHISQKTGRAGPARQDRAVSQLSQIRRGHKRVMNDSLRASEGWQYVRPVPGDEGVAELGDLRSHQRRAVRGAIGNLLEDLEGRNDQHAPG